MLPIKAKKIAVVCNYQIQPDRIGGMDRFFVAFNTSLVKQNHTIDWFFIDSKMFDFYEELNVLSTNKQNIEEFFISHLIKENKKYDIVITHFTELCTSFYKQIKQLTNAHCIAVDHNPRPLQGFPLKKRIKLRVKGFLFGKYIDKVVGVSPYCKVHLKKDYGSAISKKIIIIYNGIDTKLYLKKINFNAHNCFIVACHLREEKGVQDIINAISLLDKESLNKFKLDIYGEGNYEAHLKKQVKELNLDKYINFKGSRDDLHTIYSKYDYLLHASHGETFCFTVVESLISNLPVITTNEAGNILGLVKNNVNGFVFDIKDVKTLKTIIANIIDKKIVIDTDVSQKVENQFYLSKMVDEHIKMIEL